MEICIRLLLTISIALLHSACSTVTYSHLKMIHDGRKPKIAVIASTSDKLSVSYIGTTVFENRYFEYKSSVNLKPVILDTASKSILKDNIAVLYSHSEDDEKKLLKALKKNIEEYWNHTEFTQDEKQIFSNWGKNKQLDYIVFITPVIGRLIPEQDAVINEKGLIANINGRHYIVSRYRAYLFDALNPSLSDVVTHTAYGTLDKPLKKNLTAQEIDRIKKEWEEEQDVIDYPNVESISFDRALERAQKYYQDDYSKLTKEQLREIDSVVLSLTQLSIQNLMVKLGLAEGTAKPTWPVRNQYSKDF